MSVSRALTWKTGKEAGLGNRGLRSGQCRVLAASQGLSDAQSFCSLHARHGQMWIPDS